MTPGLVLHWQLDDLTAESRAIDSSGNHLNGAVEGDPGASPDERFGSCLVLDGKKDALTVPDDQALRLTAYTVAAWVNTAQPTRPAKATKTPPAPKALPDEVFIAGKADGFAVSVDARGVLRHNVPAAGRADVYATAAGALGWNQWHHVAVTCEGRVARIHVDGVQLAQYALPGDPLPGRAALVVGRHPDARQNYLTGRIAHLRVYDGALTAEEIRRDMAADEAALAAFVRSHPLDFELTNADQQPVLYIDDNPGGQAMTLRLVNSSRQDVELRASGTPGASAVNHHAALTFRTRTLAATAAPRVVTPGWSMAAAPGGTTFHLLHDGATTIRPGAALEVELQGLKADGAGGTRGTRVELAYRLLGYAGEPGELSGSRRRFLDVVNHRGRPGIPLDVGFVGGDRVLSDGATPSSLRVRVANVSRDTAIALAGSASAQDAASAFTVGFDVRQQGEDRQWALTESGRAGDVHFDIAGPTAVSWDIVREDLGQRVQWTLTPRADTALPPGGSLDLKLDDVYALGSPGHAPIVVAYRNVPGYQDGFASVVAERTPLLFTARDVTIGTAEPAPSAAPPARLTVSAEGRHLQLRRESDAGSAGPQLYLELYQDDPANNRDATYPSIRFHHAYEFWHRIEARTDGFHLKTGDLTSDEPVGLRAGNTSVGTLAVRGAAGDANGGSLAVGPPDGSNLRLGYHAQYGWIQSHGGKPLAVNPLGNNVSVGTTTAAPARLTVGSASEHLQLRREATTAGKILFLELYQADTATGVLTSPSIRFHHAGKFAHRIEAGKEGFYLKTGDLSYENLVPLWASGATLGSLTIGATTIGENELKILRRLASGALECDLYNTAQSEYAFAGTYTFTDNRRYVFTWGEKNTRVSQGRWRIAFPA
ncbi:LamG-like jellyroll fold domain-containing protein [Sphaerisporangium aureirubrum]|uniref:LamG-like jellyroll fold domain-containing protein n=1 Tax=Sphaerisporangium aureirubrum TaxID=1544736 RepID=A0ABW1NIV2_9ACTN